MGHEPHHVAAFVADSGDVVHRPIRVDDIAQDDAVFALQLPEVSGEQV